jgi:hypothetical protein
MDGDPAARCSQGVAGRLFWPIGHPFPGRTADDLNEPDFQLEVTLAAQNLEVELAVEEGLRQIHALQEAELAAKDKVISGLDGRDRA